MAAGLIVLAGVAVYWNSFAGVFVFDDFTSIIDNPTIRQWWRLDQVFRPPCDKGETVAGRPLLNFSLAVNYAISGRETWSYHLVNLLLHLANALLLLALLHGTFRRPVLPRPIQENALALALVIAGLWTVHPLHTEAVTYIVERAESLVALFYLLTLYAVLRSEDSIHSGWWKSVAVVACLLGMASKETMVTAPVLALIFDRTFLAGSFAEAWRRRWGMYLGLAVTWRLLVGLVLSTGLIFRSAEFAVHPRWLYALTQPQSILHYLRLAVWPYPQCAFYSWPVSESWQEIVPALAVVSVGVLGAVWAMWRRPAWGFIGAWFLGILATTSSVIPTKDVIVERRMYLPLVAVLTFVVLASYAAARAAVHRGWMPLKMAMALGVCLAGAVGVAWGLLTVDRNRVYHSSLAVWEDTVRKAPHNFQAQCNLGFFLIGAKRSEEAIQHLQEALRIHPDDAESHTNMGIALIELGRIAEAIEQYQEAIRLQPKYGLAHTNLGNALLPTGRVEEALEHYESALRVDPENALAHANLGTALSRLGQHAEAIEHHERALQSRPEMVEAHHNLGLALAAMERYPEAIERFRQALERRPDCAEFHYNLSVALMRTGAIREAIAEGRDAVRLQPDQAGFHRFLAWLMATHEESEGGSPKEAVEHAERACELTGGRDIVCLDTLAAAYASAGRFDEAVSRAKEAWQMAEAAGQDSLAEEIHIQLQLYRDRRPYREPVATPADRQR